jgi:hypothetical protein
MSNKKKYNFIILLSIFFLIILMIENYKVRKIIDEKQCKLQEIDKKIQNEQLIIKKFGYKDILNAVGNQDGIRITKIAQKKGSDIVLVRVMLSGELSFIVRALENMKNDESFQSVQNIEMEKSEDDKIVAKVNVNFIRNK